MPYAFAPRANASIGESRELNLSVGDWAGLKFEEGAHNTFYGAISRFTEDKIWDSGDEMRPDVATKVFGIPGYLKFEEPISIQRARLMNERKQEELRRMAYLNSATHSTFSLKAAMGLGAGMAGSVSNPLDFSLMFVPFAGAGRPAAGIPRLGKFAKAAEAARAGGGIRGGIQALADRGLLTTTEELGRFTRFPQFGASVINASLGNAIVEIPVFAQNMRDQAIYGPEASALNILLGGATGGAFHLAGAGLGKLLKAAARSHDMLPPEIQDATLRQAVLQTLDDKPISVEGMARTDKGSIVSDLQFDEMAARQRALEAVGVLPEEARARAIIDSLNRKQASAVDLLDMTRAKANTGKDTVEGKVAARLLERFKAGDRGVSLFKQMADLFEVRYNPMSPTVQERMKNDLLHGKMDELQFGYSTAADLRNYRQELQQIERREAGLSAAFKRAKTDEVRDSISRRISDLERRREAIFKDFSAMETELLKRSPLTLDELSSHADELSGDVARDSEARVFAAQLEARADEVRAQRVQELIDKERAALQASIEGKRTLEEISEIKQQIKAGKVLTDEEVKKFTASPVDESGLAAIKESIADVESELKAFTKAEEVKDGEMVKIVQKELDKLNDDISKSVDVKKVHDIALDCLLRNL